MSPLTIEELQDLLLEHSPESILSSKADQLDESGRAFLQKCESDLAPTESWLLQVGDHFQASLPPIPKVDLNAKSKTKVMEEPTITQKPSRKVLYLKHITCLAAAFLLGMIFPKFFTSWTSHPNERDDVHSGVVRTMGLDDAGLESANDRLFEALIIRGRLLLTQGDHAGEPGYYKEALQDFEQALQLREHEAMVYQMLALSWEKLGDDRKAKFYLEQYLARERKQKHP